MLFLDGVFEVAPDDTRPRFQWVREPTFAQLTQLAHTIARRVGRLLEREGLLERDTEQLDLGEADVETCPNCGGTVQIVTCIEDPPVIERILNHRASKDLPGLWAESRAPTTPRTGLHH